MTVTVTPHLSCQEAVGQVAERAGRLGAGAAPREDQQGRPILQRRVPGAAR